MAELKDYELKSRYTHFTKRKMPFEDTIIDVIPNSNIDYVWSDTKEWLYNLYLLTSKGYYLQCRELFSSIAEPLDYYQPYQYFLRGVLDMAFCYMYTSDERQTLDYIKSLLSKGKITVCKNDDTGKYLFLWCKVYYSWIPEEYWNN